MELKIAKEKLLLINSVLSFEDAEVKAKSKKMDAFGTINKITGLFSKISDEDFEIDYKEQRLHPFWHIASQGKYVYDRKSNYQIDVKGEEVKTVTVEGKEYEINNKHLHLPVLEHCKQNLKQEVYIDGITGIKNPNLASYINTSPSEVTDEELNKKAKSNIVVVPPQARVSGIIREMLAQTIQGIQADTIFEEEIEITNINLYYRTIYSFQFIWKSKNKKGIIEIDGVTGTVSTGTRTFSEYIGTTIDKDFLFDIGADAAGMLIPGGSIAVKAAKMIMDKNKK